MGIIINDSVPTSSGIDLVGSYASFGSSPLITYVDVDAQGNKTFSAAGNVSYFKDEASKNAGLDPVMSKRVVLSLPPATVQTVYSLFYGGLSAQYQSVSNVPDDVPTAAPAATPVSQPAASSS